MAAETDFSKPPEDILVALIKTANPTLNFKAEDVSFDNPTTTTGADALLANTEVVVRATDTGRFVGQKDVIYNRVDLAEVIRHNQSAFVERTYQGTLRDLVTQINARYGVNLKRSDIVDKALPNVYGDVATTLQAAASSLVYRGSVGITVRRAISLPAAVTVRTLNAMSHLAADPATTAVDKLLQLLNTQQITSPYPFTKANVTFGEPAAASGPNYNAKVTITAVPDHGFLNAVDVFYRRIDLGSVITPATVGLTSYRPFTPQSLIDKLNAEVGTFLKLDDLQPFTIAMPDTGVAYNVTLTAKPTSLGWRGTCDLQVAVGIPDGLSQLHNIINVDWPAAV